MTEKEIQTPEFLASLTGLSEQEATAKIQEKCGLARVVYEEGLGFICSCEFVDNRVNLSLSKGVVLSGAYIG